MSVNVHFLGHAGFVLTAGRHTVAIDPFVTGNPRCKAHVKDIHATHIVLTHAHGDHFGDTIQIAERTGATVLTVNEIAEYLGEKGLTKLEPMNPGGRVDTSFGYVALTQAFHSSSYDGRYMGMPAGAIIHLAGKTFYHTGDTALFGDMKLIGEIYKPHVAMICAGDRFTMGPQLAARAAEMIRPRIAIPIHFATFGLLADEDTVRRGFKPAGVEVKLMHPGESFDLD